MCKNCFSLVCDTKKYAYHQNVIFTCKSVYTHCYRNGINLNNLYMAAGKWSEFGMCSKQIKYNYTNYNYSNNLCVLSKLSEHARCELSGMQYLFSWEPQKFETQLILLAN